MKDIRPALRSFLLLDVGIRALVTTGATSRVYPIKIPQGVNQTCIVYSRISGQSGHHMEGRDGLARVRFQVDAWSPLADAATALANLIKDRIDGFRGVMGGGEFAVTVQGVFFAGEREDFDDAVSLHRMSRDYFVDFEEL